MTKEEKIKEAWGKYWDRLSEAQQLIALENNGYTPIGYSKQQVNLHIDLKKSKIFEVDNDTRPKSLKGIENNNGWTKIESEDDLPKENGVYWTLRRKSIIPLYKEVFNDLDCNYWLSTYTHYQPIEKPKPPIY